MLSRTAARQPTTQRTASRAEHSTLAMLPRAAQAMPLARMLSLATGAPARVAPLGRRVVRGARHLATGQAATGTASEEAPSTSGTQRICILGGGFAGLYTAVRCVIAHAALPHDATHALFSPESASAARRCSELFMCHMPVILTAACRSIAAYHPKCGAAMQLSARSSCYSPACQHDCKA